MPFWVEDGSFRPNLQKTVWKCRLTKRILKKACTSCSAPRPASGLTVSTTAAHCEPLDTQTTVRMRADIARAITLFEPRIMLEEVSFEERADEGLLLILITYTIIRTNSRSNMVYPFYLNEGTNT